MENYIIAAVIIAIITAAIIYIVKAKKSGVKCIGCPAGGQCSQNKSSECSCGCSDSKNSGCGCCADTKE